MEEIPNKEFSKMLNIFLSRLSGEKKFSLYITPFATKEEVIRDVRDAGGDEEVIGYISIEGHIADAVSSLAMGDESICDWEKFLSQVLSLGDQVEGFDENCLDATKNNNKEGS